MALQAGVVITHADVEHSEQTTSARSEAAHNTMPPFILLNWLIKT